MTRFYKPLGKVSYVKLPVGEFKNSRQFFGYENM